MKRKIIIGIGIVALLGTLGFTACHHGSPEARIGWIKEEIGERLSLDAAQQAKLDEIAADLLERRRAMHQDRESFRTTILAELSKERIDRSVIEGLVARKRRHVDETIDFMIDNAIAFHEMLTPEQRATLVAELEKLHARAEKYGHHRW